MTRKKNSFHFNETFYAMCVFFRFIHCSSNQQSFFSNSSHLNLIHFVASLHRSQDEINCVFCLMFASLLSRFSHSRMRIFAQFVGNMNGHAPTHSIEYTYFWWTLKNWQNKLKYMKNVLKTAIKNQKPKNSMKNIKNWYLKKINNKNNHHKLSIISKFATTPPPSPYTPSILHCRAKCVDSVCCWTINRTLVKLRSKNGCQFFLFLLREMFPTFFCITFKKSNQSMSNAIKKYFF